MTLKPVHRNIIIALTIVICFLGFAFNYYFIDTLKISEIIEKNNNPIAEIVFNIVDFNTGLTRYDIYNLSKNSNYWEKRLREVMAIQDSNKRNLESEKLFAEMMQDPSIKKIANKLMNLGKDSLLAILNEI
ncbi:hypothetical protein LCGC14_3148620 [marine sediment metagenome]|uniref:Uncharacterized protein n=1 Tax=marine sediment metagenome TaxID=412755 RepID=A0A0F8YJ20_9ZZZZ